MTESLPPSGDQHEIRHGEQVAVIVAVGGGVRSYSVGDRAVLDGYDVGAMCDGARGQALIPWPNRVQDGRWTWRGSERQLAITEPEQHNAIHGLLRWVAWEAVDVRGDAVTMRAVSHPQPGYPWTVEASIVWSLDDTGLTATTTLRNRSGEDVPVAAGFHPYLRVGTELIDTATLRLPVETRILTGDQQIPVGREPVAGTPYDFRDGRVIGDTRIDYAFADLQRDADGLFRLSLSSAAAAVSLWLDEAYPYVEVFTGDALPDPARRRRGLGVEPMSAPPNALATGDSLVVLPPGGEWTGRWGISPH